MKSEPFGEVPLPSSPIVGVEIMLRLWEPDDASWYVESRDAEVLKWTTESPDLTVEEARSNIERYRLSPSHAGFAIVDSGIGELLGNIALVPKDKSGRTADISYWLAPEGRGRGAATQAVELLSRWGFENWRQLERIELWTFESNVASQRVAERAGFAPDGIGQRQVDGAVRNVVIYSLNRNSK